MPDMASNIHCPDKVLSSLKLSISSDKSSPSPKACNSLMKASKTDESLAQNYTSSQNMLPQFFYFTGPQFIIVSSQSFGVVSQLI